MKNVIVLICFLFVSTFSFGQSFEGHLMYDLEYEGESSYLFSSMFPDSYTMKIKEDKSKLQMEGGMMSSFVGNFITNQSEKSSYMLMPSQKKAYKIKHSEDGLEKDRGKFEVVKMDGTEKIAGYNCTKYKVVVKMKNEEFITNIWASEDLDIKMPEIQSDQSFFKTYEEIEGFPVKIEQDMAKMNMPFSLTIVLKEAKETSIDDSEFEVPSDFEIIDGMPNLKNMMMGK